MKNKINEYSIDAAITKVIESPELYKKVDRKLMYDLKNPKTRSVPLPRKLLALYQADVLEIDIQ